MTPALAALLPLVAAATAVEPPADLRASDGSAPRRLVARFDFEENESFPQEIPQGFYRVLTRESGVPGLPPFGRISTVRGSGRGEAGAPRWCVQFQVDGGSMAMSSAPSRVPVEPDAQLLVRGFVETEGLSQAGARLSVRFHDAKGEPIGGVYSSDARRSERGWSELRIEPPPAPAGAAGLSFWLEVVQPASTAASDEHLLEPRVRIAASDVRGRVHFDDLEIWQLPAVRFTADGVGRFEPSARGSLRVRCADPGMDRVAAALEVRDAVGAIVHRAAVEVPADREVSLELPQLPNGWYEAEASFTQEGEPVARRRARFAVLPEDPFEPDEPPRFGASFVSAGADSEPAIGLARAAFVVLPVWTSATDTRDPRHEVDALRTTVNLLLDRRVEPMFRIAEVPGPLAREHRIDAEDALALVALPEEKWRPSLEPWLLAFGQQVEQWFIGRAPADGDRADLAARIEGLANAMRTAIAGPSIGLPWSPSESVPESLRATIVGDRHLLEVVADASWRADAAQAYEGFPSGPRGMARIVAMPEGSLDGRERAIDLAVRAIDAWRAGFDAIAIEVPGDEAGAVPGPPLELAAWRQLSTRLCGRRFIADIPLADGVTALLADGARGATLVLWSDASSTEVVAELGGGELLATDLWGRSARVPATARGHRLLVGREPLFVEGIDRQLCLLRRGLRMEPAFVESRRAPQEVELVLANPWDVPFTGTLTVLAPAELGITPRSQSFDAPAGGEARLPVSLGVPRSMASGTLRVRVAIDGAARERFQTELEAPLEIGYRAASVEPTWRLARSIESGTIDLVLTLTVTNRGASPLDLEAFAVADGFTQDRKPILGLAPGSTAVRVFHFADGARRLSGRDLRTGIVDPDTDARLLRRIAIPPLVPPSASFVDGTGSER